MVKYVGLNKQEQLKKLQDDAQNQVENILKSFDDNLEALTRKNTFGENALGVVLFAPSLLYRTTKGALDSVLNAAHSIYLVGANLVNDIGHIFKAEDVYDGIAKTQYAIANPFISLMEGVGNMLIDTVSLAARISMANIVSGGKIGDFVDDKLYGKDGVASALAEEANTFRASILKQKGTRKMAELILGEDKKEDIDEALGNIDKQYEGMTDEEIVNSRYSDSFKEHIQGSLDVKNWIKDNITDKYLANINTLGLGSTADAYTQNLWGDSKVYETLVGASESIGSILVSWALAKVAKQKFGMSAAGAKALSSAFFTANVFAGSFEEALNNGADMQDAYTYAASNAFMETMLENIGGFDTSGASSSSTSFYEKFIKNEKWANIVSNMVEEGMEEVGSVILGRSMSQYGDPDGTIEEQSIKDFASEAMFSFIGGALSSMGLGFGQSVYINTTANSKANQVVQTFDKKVYDLGAEKAVKIFKKDLNTFVETLNKKNAKGLKTNARGAEFIGKLDTKEKIKLVRTAGLQNVVLLNEETGNFELNPEVERMDENFFKNTSHGQIIDNSEYAISKGVVKTDISNDGKYNVLKISEMNEKEKTIYDFVKDSKSSIALVRGNVGTGTNALHDGENGVIYLNTELLENMPEKEIKERIARHEFLHHIKTVAPDMYYELAEEMEKFIDLELNEETNTLDIIYKSEEAKRVLEPILKKAKFTTTLMHNFNTHHADVSKSMLTAEQLKQVDAIVNGSNVQGEVERQRLYNSEVQKMLTEEQKKSAFNQSVEVLSEEMLAYFIENTIQGGKFVDLISKDKTLFEKVKNIFSKETDYISQISGDNKDIEAELKRMRTKFDKATERILKAENTLYHLTYHLFDDGKTAMLKHLDKELVAKYGVDEIMLAISETYDSDTGTIIIDGTTYKDTDVFVDMKDHTVRKHTQAPSDDEVRSKFVYDKRKHDVYAKELKNLIKDAQLNLKGLLINPKLNQNAIFELENMIETAKDILTTFKDGADLFEDEIKFIADLMLNVETEKGTEKGKGKPKSKPTIAATVNSNLIQKFVYRIKKSTSYKDIKNRAYNANINGAQLFYEHTKKDAKEIQEEIENVITTMSIALNTAGFQGQYFIKHFNRGNITEFIIESDDAYVDELVKKALDRIQNEEEKEKDTRSQTEIRREENTAYLNNEIDKMISFLGNDSNNVIRIDSKTTVEDIQAMKFNKDNLIVGMPAFGGKMEIDILNAALKVAPTVAIVMPITYKGSYANQNQVNKNAKLIYNEISPPLLVPTKTNKDKNSLHKVVSQVWTTADTFHPDLRLKANRPFVHNDFDSFIVNTKAQFEAYKNASDKGNFDFDFAIPFRATDINDFKKIKSFDDMKPTTKYLIIKAKDKNALNIFNLIDFAKLARTGGNVLLGFTTADLVEEYSNIAKKVKKGDIRFSKQTDNYDVVLTEEVVEYFKNSYAREDEQLSKRLKRVFHGTLYGGFMEFDGSKGEGGFYLFGKHIVNFFTDNEDVANTYTKSSRRITTLTPDEIKQILFDNFEQLANPEKVSESEYDEAFSQMARIGYYYDVEEGLGIADLYHLDEQGEYSLLAESSDIKTYQDLIDIIYRRELELQSGYRMGIYETYVNITNPLIIDGQGAYWHEIPNPDVLKNFGGTLESMRTFFNNLGAISKSGNITAIQEKLAGTRFGITEEGDKILFTRDGEILKELSREFADSEKHSMSFYDFIILRAGKKTTNDVVRDALISNENNKTDYDGVIIKNIVDIGGMNIDTEFPLSYDEALSTIYVTIKSPNQVKSVYNTNPTKNNDIRYSKNLTQLTPEEERNIINTFGDANLKSLFVKDAKTGAFKLKSNLIRQTKRSNKVKINGTIYDANKYAINVYHNFENHNINVKAHGYKAPIEIDKLSAEHRIMYDVLSTSNLSFVMYDSGKVRTNAIGFSLTNEKANVVFLNVKYLSGGNFVDTLIHEHIHEAFKAKTMDSIAYGKGLIDLLFDTSDGTVKTTAVFDAINSKYSQYGGDFYSYFTAYTKQSGYVKIRNHQEFYNLLSSNVQPDTKEYRTLNEITAQFYGTLFSDTKAVHIALQGKNSNNVMLYNIFSNLLNNPNIPQTIKTFLQNSLQGISKLFKNYLQEIEKMFPSNRAYTLAELNKFIKEFSSGEFKTRKSLIDAYIKEKAQNTRGKASVVIDNVLYIASQFEKVIQSGTQAFTQLQEEFSNFKNDVELLLTNENALLNLTGTDMPKKIKELTDLIKEMQVIQKETGDAFTNFAMVEALRELVYDLNDLYNSYNDDVIRILGFPNRNTLTVFAQSVINELDDLLNYLSNNTTYPDIGKYIKKVLSNLDNFIDVLKSVNTALKSNKGLFGQITKLQKSYRESRIKNLLSAITTRVNNYMNHLLNNNTLQKRSPVNDDLEAISALYSKMVKVIKDNQFNFNNMRVELIPILAELKTMIELSERVPDDSKQNLIIHVYNLAKNFTGLTKDTTFMLSLFPDDKNFINLSASEFTKDYSESSIAKSLIEIIKAFETVYTSSFGNDQYTHDEYSRKTINQIRNIKKAMKSERLEKLAYLTTPQDYYALFKDTFPEVDFFKDMYDAYIQAAIRKDNITAQFGDAYRDFKKKNDKLHDYSLEEIEVSGIFQMRKSDIDMIMKEVQDEIDRLQDLVSASAAVISKLKGEKKLIRQAIKEKRILIANALPYSAEKARLEKELKKLQKDLNAKNAEIKKAEADKKANEAKRDTYNRDVVFQERFHELMGERYPNYNTGQPVKLRRGTVISLYMSIVRELEMKEIHQNGGNLAPTNHLNYLSQFYAIDNDIIKTKGWQYAKDNAAPYVILEKDIVKLKDSLEALLSDEDSRKIIEFARERLNWNYESTDEIFFAKHKTHLPKQPSYFPFRTIQSDNKRDIELKNAKAYNVGVATGFVKATTEGASTPLLIENVFDVIEKHSEMVANYSFDRFIYDFENLRVNKSSGTTFQNEITGKGSKLGTGHGFERFFETTMRNILNYKDKEETKRVRATKKVLHATVSATMALNIPSTIKQLASIYTISRKNGLPLNSMLQNVLVSLTGGNKRLRDWLMKNNGNFNLRAQYNNIPALSMHVTPDFTYRVDGVKKKIVDFLSAPVGWFDNAVLVGAFKTIYDQEKLANPAATENEILELANERFYDVLIFGVANTSSAFRSAFSNDDNVLMQIASRFQSENVIQVSALIRRMYAISNGVIGSWREFANHLAAFLASGFFTAVVSSITASARGYEKDDSEIFDFWVNEFLWGNIVGGIPLLNNFTGMIRFDSKKGLQKGFEPRQPLLTDFYNLVNIVSTMNEKNFARKGVQALEIAGNIYGIPIRNVNRIISTTSRFIKNKTANDIQAFYSYKTKQQMFNQGVKDGNKQIISRYIKEEISNNAVREEMIRLALRNPDKKLNLYVGVTSFKKQNEDGVMVEYKIPIEIKGKYSELAQKTLRKLILQANYKKLDDAGKIIALQRVINYYNNYMKEVVLNKNPKDLKAMLEMDAVIKNALKV